MSIKEIDDYFSKILKNLIPLFNITDKPFLEAIQPYNIVFGITEKTLADKKLLPNHRWYSLVLFDALPDVRILIEMQIHNVVYSIQEILNPHMSCSPEDTLWTSLIQVVVKADGTVQNTIVRPQYAKRLERAARSQLGQLGGLMDL